MMTGKLLRLAALSFLVMIVSLPSLAEGRAAINAYGPAGAGTFSPRLAESHALTGSATGHDLQASSQGRTLDGSATPKTLHGSATGRTLATSESSYARGSYLQPENNRLGTQLSADAFRRLDCNPSSRRIAGAVYYRCSRTWYRRYYSRGEVTYEVVPSPE